RIAAAPSPPVASSVLVGRPPRVSAVTTSTDPRPSSAARNDPIPDRTAPPVSIAGGSWSRRSAAWIEVALVFSRYDGFAVADPRRVGLGAGPGAPECQSRRLAPHRGGVLVVAGDRSGPASAAAAKEGGDLGPVEPPVRHVAAGADDPSHGSKL